jgi:hypothetical protein
MKLAIKKIGPGNRITLSKYDFSHRLPPVYWDFDPLQMKFFQRSQADPQQHQKECESMVLRAHLQRRTPLAPRLR